jgi:hypothetical protein
MQLHVVDELDFGFGWFLEQGGPVPRTSHALVDDGRVWLVDPVDADGLAERIDAVGTPVGVVQLIDRHDRDCAALAERYGVPLHATPFHGIPDSSFEVKRVARLPFWKEVALWWPARRTLVVGDALGTLAYFRAPGEALGVHPLLRLTPPRSLRGLVPEHVLCGHGPGVHGADAATALQEALVTARRRIPTYVAGLIRRRDEL